MLWFFLVLLFFCLINSIVLMLLELFSEWGDYWAGLVGKVIVVAV